MKPTKEQLSQWGTSLREIDPSSLIPDEDGATVHWYLGDNGTELFAWSRGADVPHHLQLVFARVSVEWTDDKGLVTGTFKAGATSSGGRYDPYLLSVGQHVDPEVCGFALALLDCAPIDERVIQPLVAALRAVRPG